SITDSDDNDGNMAQPAVAFESFEDEESVPSRHAEVQEDGDGLMEASCCDGLHAIGSPHGMKVIEFEDCAQQAPAIEVVIDNQNFCFHEGHPCKSSIARGEVLKTFIAPSCRVPVIVLAPAYL